MENIGRFSRDEHAASVGQRFTAGGRDYDLAGNIGNGAIGIVRKAVDIETGTVVAVKFLAPESRYIDIASFEDINQRFRREGERGPSLIHDNLVRIYGYEENINASQFEGGQGPLNPFIVMEFAQGRTLEDLLRKQRTGPRFNINVQTLHLAYSIATALQYLHERNLVHRDVKPANIFLSKEFAPHKLRTIKLGDFGVVKWGDFKASMTTGTLTMTSAQGLGTYKYMAPEQAMRPKDVGVRADMYALGITLFELFTNQILPSPHHIFNLSRLRYQRLGTTMSKLMELGLGMVPLEYESLFSTIFDCFLTAPDGRPSSKQMSARLWGFFSRAEDDLMLA